MGSFVNGETLNDKAILSIIRYLLFDLADRYAADVAAGDLVSCMGAKIITSILAASIPLFMIYNMALTCKLCADSLLVRQGAIGAKPRVHRSCR